MSISGRLPTRAPLTASLLRTRDTLPEGAARAFMAGVEGAVLGWLCVVVPAIASYVATAAAPALGDATWLHAATAGAALWRLGHGGDLALGEVTVTLVPLGITAVIGGIAFACLRRARIETWTGVLSGTAGYAAAVALLAALPPTSVVGAATAAFGGLVVGAGSAGAAVVRRRRALPPVSLGLQRHLDRIPEDVRRLVVLGVRGAGFGSAILLGLGALLVLVSLAGNLEVFTASWGALRVDPVGGAMLVLATALLLPTAAVWAVAWVSGTGFALGTGTLVAPDDVSLGAVPVFPLLAAVPRASPIGAWTALLVVLTGAGVGWYLHRRAPGATLWHAVGSVTCSAVGCAAVLGLLADAASGSVGPGRMALVGPDAGSVSLTVLGLVALGSFLVVLPARPETARLARLARLRSGERMRAFSDPLRSRRG